MTFGYPQHPDLAVLLSFTTIFLFFKSLHVFRGFAKLGWIVQVLKKNCQDMSYFLIVILTGTVFYALISIAIFSGDATYPDDVDDDLVFGLELTGDDAEEYMMPFFLILNTGFMGDFSSGAFKHAENPFMARLYHVIFVVLFIVSTSVPECRRINV